MTNKKIDKLTKEQKVFLEKHKNEYLAWGLSCEPIDKDAACSTIGKMYEKIGKKNPYYWICQSPAQLILVITFLKNCKGDIGSNLGSNLRSNLGSNLRSNLGSNLRSNLGSNLWSNLESNLWSNLWSNLRSNLGSNLRSNLWSNLESNLGSNLGSNLESNLWSNLGSNLRSNLGSNLRSNLWSNLESNLGSNLGSNLESNLWSNLRSNLGSNLRSNLRSNLESNLGSNLESNLQDSNFWGQLDMFWIAFYRYPEQYLNINYGEYSKILFLWDILGKSCGWWYPYENICFISDRPQEIHKKGIQLHNESGPALLYRDGYALWFLNGVDVGEEIIKTPAEKIDAKLVVTNNNAEVRREIVRKMGIELVCQRLGSKCIDKKDNYELLLLDLQDGRNRPYLKMLNPSIGVYHIEGVHPDCNTVEKALNWRNQVEGSPVILT